MKKIFIIEVDESDTYDDYRHILNKSFTTKLYAEEYLLEHFDKMESNGNGDWFVLKDDHHRISEFGYGATALIIELDLVK